MYDESMYRLLPHGLAPAGGGGGMGLHAPPHATSIDSCLLAAATGACYGMTDEELQREYAVVLDALNGGPSAAAAAAAGGNPCCNAACHQIAAESPREHTLGCGKFNNIFWCCAIFSYKFFSLSPEFGFVMVSCRIILNLTNVQFVKKSDGCLYNFVC